MAVGADWAVARRTCAGAGPHGGVCGWTVREMHAKGISLVPHSCGGLIGAYSEPYLMGLVAAGRGRAAAKAAHLRAAGAGLSLPLLQPNPLSESTFNSAMARMCCKYLSTAHGFRALFSNVANEAGRRLDVIERQLAHKERNQVRAAYQRSTYMAERTKLIQCWVDYLDATQSGADAGHALVGQGLARTRHQRETSNHPPRRFFCAY